MTDTQKQIKFMVDGFFYLVQSDGNLSELNKEDINQVLATECIYPIVGYFFKTKKIVSFAKNYDQKKFTHIPVILYSDRKKYEYLTHSLCLFSIKEHRFEQIPGFYYSIIENMNLLINQ
jgi:hypothetical protein